MERLFSSGSNILRPKRSTLRADNYANLIFGKGNLHLLIADLVAVLHLPHGVDERVVL
jgi:hypothetical protein